MRADEAAEIRTAIIAKLKQTLKELFEARNSRALRKTEDQISLYTAVIKNSLALNAVLADRQGDIIQKAIEEAEDATSRVAEAQEKVGERNVSQGRTVEAFRRLKKIAAKGVVAFCKEACGFEPTSYQRRFLLDDNQFIAQRWCRQSGKDHSASAKLFWYAVSNDGVYLGVVGPSQRQSKLVIRKINAFITQKLPADIPYQVILLGRKTLRTKVPLVNGSLIEAFPCNPDTIRGPTLHGILATEFNRGGDLERVLSQKALLLLIGSDPLNAGQGVGVNWRDVRCRYSNRG